MPMIDVYAAAGTFSDKHGLAQNLANAVMRWEKVPPINLFTNNTAAFIPELPVESISNAAGENNYVRVQVLTPVAALDREKQLGVVRELTDIVAAAAKDPTLSSRTWVVITESPEVGWGIDGHANTSADIVAAARSELAKQGHEDGPLRSKGAISSKKEKKEMSSVKAASTATVPTQFLETKKEKYAYRRWGDGPGLPLLCLQHFTGTLDNWDPAVTDSLAAGREVVLFESAGIGRSSGKVPDTIAGMAVHAQAFLDGLGLNTCDVLGFSLGGMVAQQMVLDRPSVFRRMILVGTAPRGGEDVMHLDKPSLAKPLGDTTLKGYEVLQKIFFAPTETSQVAGKEFIGRLMQRQQDREPISGREVAQAQMAAFREWEKYSGERFADLKRIQQPALVINGIHDEMIPVSNSYWLSENLPNAVLLTYPDSGHGSLFQWHDSFTRQVGVFLASESPYAPY